MKVEDARVELAFIAFVTLLRCSITAMSFVYQRIAAGKVNCVSQMHQRNATSIPESVYPRICLELALTLHYYSCITIFWKNFWKNPLKKCI